MNREDFVKKYAEIVNLAARFAEIARRESLLGLSDRLDDVRADDDRDVFKYGIVFAIDGVAVEIIDKILTNLVNQEKDADERLFKTLQKEAVLMIQQGFNPRIMLSILNSYTDISLKEHNEIIMESDDKDEDKGEGDNKDGSGGLSVDEISTLLRSVDSGEVTVGGNSKVLSDDEISAFLRSVDSGEVAVGGEGEGIIVTDKLNFLLSMTDRDIQAVLRNLDVVVLVTALKGAVKEVRVAFFRNMSKRATDMVKEDMEYMGAPTLTSVEEAQEKIVELVKRLAESGDIDAVESDDESEQEYEHEEGRYDGEV